MEEFIKHLADSNPCFICYHTRGDEASELTVEVDHLIKQGASDSDLEQFASKLTGDVSEIIEFYRMHDGAELYRHNEMPSIEFYQLVDIDEQNESWRVWFDMLDEDDLQEFQKYGVAFGEVSCSGNYFIWHEGKVYYSNHDGEEDDPLANTFNEFLNLIAKNPASFLYDMGCYTRFSDGKTDLQWIPKEYVSGSGL